MSGERGGTPKSWVEKDDVFVNVEFAEAQGKDEEQSLI